MRLLHTADLHLGRQFNGISLEEDQAAMLAQIAGALRETQADALIVAGDVFDRGSPPASAVALFNDFLSRVVVETQAAVVLIAGNHDSGDRIAAMSIMADTDRALIRGALGGGAAPLILSDTHGSVAISALPFAYEYAACAHYDDEALKTPEAVLRAQIAEARDCLPSRVRWVVVAHAFIAGAAVSEGERPLTRVGGIETVSPSVFEGAHYVALGHLHRPQAAGADHIRYAGAPLAFGFDEARAEKSMSLVEIDADGVATVETIPFRPLRGVRVLRGHHVDLLVGAQSEDFVKIILSDEHPVIDAMARLREVYPNACELTYAPRARAAQALGSALSSPRAANPLDVMGAFLDTVRGAGASDPERAVVVAALDEIGRNEDAR